MIAYCGLDCNKCQDRSNEIREAVVKLNTFNKKDVDKALIDLLNNLCFWYLSAFSKYLYSIGASDLKYNNFCEKVFNRVKESVKNARRSNNLEEFEEHILECIYYTEGLAKQIHEKYDYVGEVPEDPDSFFEFQDSLPTIYDRFFKRARKYSPRKRRK